MLNEILDVGNNSIIKKALKIRAFEQVLLENFYKLEARGTIHTSIGQELLPVVLSENEIISILKVCSNLKHKAILMVIYSAGLRISECINLKICDIDSNRMQIRIEQSKGKKDRYTLLANKTLQLLRTYFKEYQPKKYLFGSSCCACFCYLRMSFRHVFSSCTGKLYYYIEI